MRKKVNFSKFLDNIEKMIGKKDGQVMEFIALMMIITILHIISNPLNHQSFKYEEKRGYLENFMRYLHEKDFKIKLAKDFGIGSSFLSGYQVVVWGKK